MKTANPLLNAALKFLMSGKPIFSVDRATKKPLKSWKRYQDTLPARDEVGAWWTQQPNANIGMATGHLSGVVVVDCDSEQAATRFIENYPEAEDTLQAQTGRGRHFYLAYDDGIRNDAGKLLGTGIDVRGEGGFIILPPSIHANGKPYKWLNRNRPIPLPARLRDVLVSRNKTGSLDGSAAEGIQERFDTPRALAGVPEGQRDETLFRLACKLRNADVPQNMAKRLIQEAAKNCNPPFPECEALGKVSTAYRRYEPRQSDSKPSASRAFCLIQAKDLLAFEEPETEWLWEGILPAGGLSLLAAKPKVGKTTLAFNLAIAVAGGRNFLGKKTKQSVVVYLALEEKRSEIRKKLKNLGETPEGLSFHFGTAPEKAIQEVRTLIQKTKAGFLIVDVLQKLCRVKDLNDYAQVTSTLEPLMATAREENCHILLTHHAGKADRQDGDDILGSTALLGGVDTSIHIKKRDKRRSFFTIQRYSEDTPETVIELKADGSLEAMGTRQEVEMNETMPDILQALEGEKLTEKEIYARVERDKSKVAKALRRLHEQGKVNRDGSGRKGDPYTYENAPFLPLVTYEGSKGESETRHKPLELLPKFSLGHIDKDPLNDGSSKGELSIEEVLAIFPGSRIV